MYSTALIALVASSFLQGVVAQSPRHVRLHLNAKRGVVTEVVTVTDWVTVTAHGPEPTPDAVAVESTVEPTTTTTESSAAPTEEAFQAARIRPTEVPVPAPVVPEVPSPVEPAPVVPAPVVPEVPVVSDILPVTGGGNSAPSGARGRGLAFNDPNLLTRFLQSGSKITWTYNWAQTDPSNSGVEFVPMMWGTSKGFPNTWEANAKKMIAAGSKALFSFNEPDHHEQANLSPQDAAAAHKKYMNPFQGQARIGTPSVTNSGSPNQGLSWLKSWFDACAGGCAADFVNIHMYGFNADQFLAHLLKTHEMFGKPVWVTEFAFDGSEAEVNRQLATVIHEMENNPKYSFVERYSYFMAAEGILVKGNSISTYGNTFAYAS